MAAEFDKVSDALKDLQDGKMIIVCDDKSRENEGDLVCLAKYATVATINFMMTHARGLVCMAVGQDIATRLGFNKMVENNTDNFGTAFTVSVDHISNGTGISAFDRATTIAKIIDPKSIPSDFRRPGHMFPLIARKHGVLERRGHTEAAVDLAKICKVEPAGVICEITNADGSMAREKDLSQFKKQFNLKMITIADLISYRKMHEKLLKREADALLPTRFGKFRIVGYTNILNNEEALAMVKHDNVNSVLVNPLVRIHSECLTGDVFHSLRCDCGEQLHKALQRIEDEGNGVVIYLRQEGRGIGLINKLRAYELQQDGFDTVEANTKLGFEPDLREYFVAAQILQDLGISKVRLITNNPQKIAELEAYGIEVLEVVKEKSTVYPENEGYLNVKMQKFGHFI